MYQVGVAPVLLVGRFPKCSRLFLTDLQSLRAADRESEETHLLKTSHTWTPLTDFPAQRNRGSIMWTQLWQLISEKYKAGTGPTRSIVSG